MVGLLSPDTSDIVPFVFAADGKARQVTLPAMVTVTGPETNVACACMGLGLIQVPRYRVSSGTRQRRAGRGARWLSALAVADPCSLFAYPPAVTAPTGVYRLDGGAVSRAALTV
jgi:hypothetical protein